jgi:hypothetical protein
MVYQFDPDITLLLKDVDYHENSLGSRNQNEREVFQMERLYIALDQISLYNIEVEFDDRVEADKESLFMNRMMASFRFSSSGGWR